MPKQSRKPACVVVVPNINGIPHLVDCLASLKKQTAPITIVVVDNNSQDASVATIKAKFPEVTVLHNAKNYGFTGGVNPGMQWAIDNNYPFVALLNNDAIAHKDWAKHLLNHMRANPSCGIATSKIADMAGHKLDSTGEFYTVWGLPYARGRDEVDKGQYDRYTNITAASGGASIYRASMLKRIGLFDQDFFAYYEDVDISLRARLAGWQINFVPSATVRHAIGVTGSSMPGFFYTYQNLKNLPLVITKNVPLPLVWKVLPRLLLAHSAYFWKAVLSGRGLAALKGAAAGIFLTFKKLPTRWRIQASRKISVKDFGKLLTPDLPPDDVNLHRLRKLFTGR